MNDSYINKNVKSSVIMNYDVREFLSPHFYILNYKSIPRLNRTMLIMIAKIKIFEYKDSNVNWRPPRKSGLTSEITEVRITPYTIIKVLQ